MNLRQKKIKIKMLHSYSLTREESLTSICASSFPFMLKLQKRPLS